MFVCLFALASALLLILRFWRKLLFPLVLKGKPRDKYTCADFLGTNPPTNRSAEPVP